MKNRLRIIMVIFFILISTFTIVNAASITEDDVNTNINIINSTLANKQIDPKNPNYLTEILDENGNVPSYQYYTNHIESRSIKVLKAYDGKIFMGLGDWNDNTGPVKVLYYDTADGKVKTSGTIADEAIENFTIIDDKLYTTGCDPRADWGYGSFYVYNKAENKWEQHLKNNGWVHVFDVVEFKDKLFMYGETTGNVYSHVQYSEDGGETFVNTKIFYNETDVSHYADFRCKNLVSYNGNLYAFFMLQNGTDTYRGIYLYDENNNQFNYYSSLPYPKSIGITYFSKNYYGMKNVIFNPKYYSEQ